MKTSQYLRKLPFNPVMFYYEGNDTIPVVLVLKLLHDELNPGFMGINLNYLPPDTKLKLLNEYKLNFDLYHHLYSGEIIISQTILALSSHCLRRYNYNKIDQFLYRGALQNHN